MPDIGNLCYVFLLFLSLAGGLDIFFIFTLNNFSVFLIIVTYNVTLLAGVNRVIRYYTTY